MSAPYGADVYKSTGTGEILDCSINPARDFTIQVVKFGDVTSWTVVLEASLDGVQFDAILTHTNDTPGNGKFTVSGSQKVPARFMRSQCTGIVVGPGGYVIANILGMP